MPQPGPVPVDLDSLATVVPFHTYIWKVASRCNLDCTYCYVYNSADQRWRRQPKLMSTEVARQSAIPIREHCERHGKTEAVVLFHGGEPLMGAVEQFARQHFLMVNEVVCYALAGSAPEADGRFRYDAARFVGYGLAQDRYADQLAAGDRLRVEDGTIHVWRGDELIHSLETSCADGIMDVPAVLSFD